MPSTKKVLNVHAHPLTCASLCVPLSAGPYPHVCRWHLFFCKGTADFSERGAKFFSMPKGLVESRCTSKKHLKNTGIGNIVERSFKFLLLENIK